MDPHREIVFTDSSNQVLQDRYEMPLFFIIGGSDDIYLSNLIGRDIKQLVKEKSVDPLPTEPFGVYASRSLLTTNGYARTFPLEDFTNKKWPILLDITKDGGSNKSFRKPTTIETVWIIRALRRINNIFADKLFSELSKELYPQKLSWRKIPRVLTVDTLSQLYLNLSEEQKKYPLFVFSDDLPIQLNTTLGDTLKDISLTSCTSIQLSILQTSLNLLSDNFYM